VETLLVFGYLLGGYWLLAVGYWSKAKYQKLKAKSFSTKFLPEPKNLFAKMHNLLFKRYLIKIILNSISWLQDIR